MKLSVHTATIETRHGTNHYAATTREELYSDLATYCRENWEEEMGDDPGDPPEADEEIVDAYFDASDFHNEYLETNEHFLTLPGVLPAVTDRQHATILAALRFWQHHNGADVMSPVNGIDFSKIASDDFTFAPLDADEIDTLCEDLNLDVEFFPAKPLPTPEHIAYTILDDIAPVEDLMRCRSFEELHGYVDANTLGISSQVFTGPGSTLDLVAAAQALVAQWLATRHDPDRPTWDTGESLEHPDWPLEDWQSDVRAGDTRKGYIQWVNYNLATWAQSPATPADEPQPTP